MFLNSSAYKQIFCLLVLQQIRRVAPRDGVDRCQRVSHGHPHLPPGAGAGDQLALLRNALLASLPLGNLFSLRAQSYNLG